MTNCCRLPTQDARLSGYLPATFLPLSHCPLPGAPWGLGNRQTETQGLAPAPTPPGAPQGAAGDSSPSQLSYVSFLLRWGLGVNQLLGAGSLGQPAVLSLGLCWGGGGRGQEGTWGESKHTVLPASHTTHLLFLRPL